MGLGTNFREQIDTKLFWGDDDDESEGEHMSMNNGDRVEEEDMEFDSGEENGENNFRKGK